MAALLALTPRARAQLLPGAQPLLGSPPPPIVVREPSLPPSVKPPPSLPKLPPSLPLPPGLPQPPLVLQEPPLPPPREIREIGESPFYYRLPRTIGQVLRLGLGMNTRLPLAGDTTKVAFTFDILNGMSVRFGRGAKAGMLFEAGYSFVGFGEHLGQIGLGLVVRDLGPHVGDDNPRRGAIAVALIPHFLAGSSKGALALGERSGLLFVFWGPGLEVSHQLTLAAGHPTHEIHLTFVSASFDVWGNT